MFREEIAREEIKKNKEEQKRIQKNIEEYKRIQKNKEKRQTYDL